MKPSPENYEVKAKQKRGKIWLIAIARGVAERLRLRRQGTSLHIRIPKGATAPFGRRDEWCASIGSLGRNQLHLEVWFSRFSGHLDRKLWAGFRSTTQQPLTSICKMGSHNLWPIRVVTPDDLASVDFVLEKPLVRSEFNAPILEKYGGGSTYFGIYNLTKGTTRQISQNFCACAAAFFEDVARALSRATLEGELNEVFPQSENRQRVVSHLQRERSRLLATECKIRDNYTCQVCRMRFEEVYGVLGKEFAEAHHLVPLSKLRGPMKTQLP